jgi:hypothetical protein
MITTGQAILFGFIAVGATAICLAIGRYIAHHLGGK